MCIKTLYFKKYVNVKFNKMVKTHNLVKFLGCAEFRIEKGKNEF